MLTLLAAFATPAPLPSPQEPAATTHDLRFDARADRPLLAELEARFQVALQVEGQAKTKPVDFGYESRLAFVDEPLTRDQPAAGDFEVRRTILAWEEDELGARKKKTPRDGPFTGARAVLSMRGGELGVELQNRVAPQKDLETLLQLAGCARWVELPASVGPGATLEVDASSLVPLLLNTDAHVKSGQATLTLTGVDGSGVATLDGRLPALLEKEGDASRMTFEGNVRFLVDTGAHLLTAVEWSGDVRMLVADETGRASGSGRFQSKLTLTSGAPAKKAVERKPSYRDVPRTLKALPVTFELPSHWYAVESETAGEEVFRSSVHDPEKLVTLEIRVLEGDSQEFASTADALVRELEKAVRLETERTPTSPLGKGRSVRYSLQDAGQKYGVLLELYPCGKNHMIRVRLGAPGPLFDDAVREWADVVRSFKLEE